MYVATGNLLSNILMSVRQIHAYCGGKQKFRMENY